MTSNFKLKGLVAAPFTPFHENGDLNLSLIEPYIESLLADGVKNVFICGTTGEGANMTLPERKLVAEKWIELGKNKFDAIVVHVGCGNLRETVELAKHAEQVGASAIAALPPVFFKPKTIDHLVDYLKAVGQAAPKLPLYYYHIPAMTGVNFSMFGFVEVAQNKLPNLAGIKFSHNDTVDMMRCLQEYPNFQFCLGNDSMLLPSLTYGSEAFVGSTYNFCGKACNRLLEAYARKDVEAARKEQYTFLAMVKAIAKYEVNTATLKCIMTLSRLDVGPARAPLPNLTAEQKEDLKKLLTGIGYFDWIK